MQKYKVEIIETLSKVVEVEAENGLSAIDFVEKNYNKAADDGYILTPDNHVGTFQGV